MLKAVLSLLSIVFLCVSVFPQKTVVLDKPLNDGSGQLAKEIVGLFMPHPNAEARQNAMKPLTIGLFGWKALRYANLGASSLEAHHLNICVLALKFYDNELESTINAYGSRLKSNVDWVPAKPEEKAKIRKFVVEKYGGEYLGLLKMFSGEMEEPNKEDQWKFMLGSTLGETGADITLWHVFKGNKTFDGSMAERFISVSKKADDAPAGTPAGLLTKLRAFGEFGKKTQFTYPEKQKIVGAFRELLLATMEIANTAKPVSAVKAPVATRTPVPARTPVPSSAATAVKTTQPPLPSVKERVKKFMDEGRSLASAGRHSDAVEKFSEAAKIDPQNGLVYANRAVSQHALGMTDKAINDANTAIMLKADLANSYYNRGIFYLAKNSLAAAWSDFDKSFSLAPTNAKAIYNRGIASFRLANYDKAAADLSTALRLDPNYTNAYVSRALVYCKMGLILSANRDQDKAIELGAKITKGCPKN